MKKLALPILLILIGIILLIVYFIQPGGSDSLDIKITNTPVVMPAAYKVYGNKDALDGKYYLFKMLMTNTGSKTMHNVKVEYSIPGYIDWTELDKISYLYPGQSSVVACYPKFKDDIVDKTTASKEKTDIRITYDGNKNNETDESFGFTMEGRNDLAYTSIPASQVSSYSDLFDNADLIPCFVTPDDPIVKYFTQQIQEKVLKGEAASVENSPKESVRFLAGVYEATKMAHFVYSGTSGIPEKFGDVSALVQRIRLPREVITGKTGLCIELTLMYASILEDAGLHAIIYLAPNHAYPGFELNGQYYAIESTGINGEGLGGILTADEALKLGGKNLDKLIQGLQAGDQRYEIIDVNKLNSEGAVPMEMKDDDYLRKKVDEIAQNFEPGQIRQDNGGNNQQYANNTRRDNNDNNRNDGSSRMVSYYGSANFNYPSLWNRTNNPYPQFPILVSVLTSPDKMASTDVYSFDGINNPEDALDYLQQSFSQSGVQIQYSYYRSSGKYQIYRGRTISSQGTYDWVGVMKPTSNGLTAVVAGAYTQVYRQYQNTINSIINSVR